MNKTMFNDSVILITGGTGSFGTKFVSMTLKKFNPRKLIVLSRDEIKQWDMSKTFEGDERIRFFIGDVRDKGRLHRALQGVDYVVHAAATKIVPTAEYNPFECVKTNINGAMNLIDAAIDQRVKKVVALSTDKASSPVNLYGATKLASDKLFVASNYSYANGQETSFSVVRYGNVMGSRGSIIPILVDKKTNQVSITDLNMTRFNITLNESIILVLDTIEKCEGGEIVIPKIPSYKLQTLVKALARNKKIKIIGVRKGEKLHEELLTKSESINALEAKDKFLLFSDTKKKTDILKKNYRFMKKITKEFSYNSRENKDYLTVQELKDLTKQEDLF